MVELVRLHLLPHLAEVLVHDLVVGRSAVVVNFLSELHDVSWVDHPLEVLVTDVPHTFEFRGIVLRIRVRNVEALQLCRRVARVSSLGHRGSHHGEVLPPHRVHHRSTISRTGVACSFSVECSGHSIVLSERLPLNFTVLGQKLSNLEHYPQARSFLDLVTDLGHDLLNDQLD